MTDQMLPHSHITGDGFDINTVFKADDYRYFYEETLNESYSEKEVNILIRELPLHPHQTILDLACGHERHANQLAARGYDVTGVNQSQEFLDLAVRDVKNEMCRFDTSVLMHGNLFLLNHLTMLSSHEMQTGVRLHEISWWC